MKQSRAGEPGEMSHFVTLWWPSVSGVSGAIRGAHLHWTLDTPDNAQPAANLIDDTQNSNYKAFLSHLKKDTQIRHDS